MGRKQKQNKQKYRANKNPVVLLCLRFGFKLEETLPESFEKMSSKLSLNRRGKNQKHTYQTGIKMGKKCATNNGKYTYLYTKETNTYQITLGTANPLPIKKDPQ